MQADEESLKQRQSLRLRVLKTMFDETIGAEIDPSGKLFSPNSIAEGLELDVKSVALALQYLENERLLTSSAEFGDPYDLDYSLTHRGITEVERAIEYPNQRTEHFMLSVVQNFNAPVGSVQNGANATVNLKQSQTDE